MRTTMTTAAVTNFAAMLVPEMFREVDYAALNGVEGIGGVADPGINTESEWDFGRYAEFA